MKPLRTWLDNKVELRDDRGNLIAFDDETKYEKQFDRMVPIPPHARENVLKYGVKLQREAMKDGPDEGRMQRGWDAKGDFNATVDQHRTTKFGWGRWLVFVLIMILTIRTTTQLGQWLLRPFGLSPILAGILGSACVLIAYAAIAWLITFTPIGVKSRRHDAQATCFKRLLMGLCGACEFDLDGVTEQADGCKVCSECGAAWKMADWKLSHIATPAFDADADSFVWVRNVKIMDGRGAVVRFLAKRKRSEARRVIRASSRKQWLCWSYIDLGLLIWLLLSGVGLYLIHIHSPSSSVPLFASVLGFCGMMYWVMARALRAEHLGKKVAIEHLVIQHICPACEETLDSTPCHADNRLLCPTCGCAWDAPNTPNTPTIINDVHQPSKDEGGVDGETQQQVLP